MLSLPEPLVQPLVGKLRSHKPEGVAKIYIFFIILERELGVGKKKRLKIGIAMWQKLTILCDRRGKVKYQLYIINMEETAM